MKEKSNVLWVTLVADAFALNVSFLFYIKFREAIPIVQFNGQIPMLVSPMLVMMFFWVGLFWLFGLYRTKRFVSRYEQVTLIFQSVTTGAIILFLLIYVDDYLFEQSYGIEVTSRNRFGVIFYWAILIGMMSFVRVANATIIRKKMMRGVGRQTALIIGTGNRAKELAEDIQNHPALGLNIFGFIEEHDYDQKDSLHLVEQVVGKVSDIPTLITSKSISTVIIASEINNHEELLKIIGLCEGRGVELKVLPDMYEIVSGAAQTTQIYGMPLINLDPKLLTPLEENLKRMFDIVVSLVVLVVGFPFWCIISILVWRDTKATPIYTQQRVGLHRKLFTLYKFRSMLVDAESTGPKLTQKEDDRITPFGRILRKYRIDEFPQFFNVLIGNMSIVGPRPEREYFIEQITKHAPHYTRLHRVKPGITSWGQVKFGYASNVEEMVDRLKYDLFYVENMSFGMDIKIIIATVYVVITGRGQ